MRPTLLALAGALLIGFVWALDPDSPKARAAERFADSLWTRTYRGERDAGALRDLEALAASGEFAMEHDSTGYTVGTDAECVVNPVHDQSLRRALRRQRITRGKG